MGLQADFKQRNKGFEKWISVGKWRVKVHSIIILQIFHFFIFFFIIYNNIAFQLFFFLTCITFDARSIACGFAFPIERFLDLPPDNNTVASTLYKVRLNTPWVKSCVFEWVLLSDSEDRLVELFDLDWSCDSNTGSRWESLQVITWPSFSIALLSPWKNYNKLWVLFGSKSWILRFSPK